MITKFHKYNVDNYNYKDLPSLIAKNEIDVNEYFQNLIDIGYFEIVITYISIYPYILYDKNIIQSHIHAKNNNSLSTSDICEQVSELQKLKDDIVEKDKMIKLQSTRIIKLENDVIISQLNHEQEMINMNVVIDKQKAYTKDLQNKNNGLMANSKVYENSCQIYETSIVEYLKLKINEKEKNMYDKMKLEMNDYKILINKKIFNYESKIHTLNNEILLLRESHATLFDCSERKLADVNKKMLENQDILDIQQTTIETFEYQINGLKEVKSNLESQLDYSNNCIKMQKNMIELQTNTIFEIKSDKANLENNLSCSNNFIKQQTCVIELQTNTIFEIKLDNEKQKKQISEFEQEWVQVVE